MSSTVHIADGLLRLTVPFVITRDEEEFVRSEWLRAWAENSATAGCISIDAERFGEDLVVSIRVR
jgi:hypothetical protein